MKCKQCNEEKNPYCSCELGDNNEIGYVLTNIFLMAILVIIVSAIIIVWI